MSGGHRRKTQKAKKRYPLQSYWSGPPLSLLEQMCLQSWVAFGATVDLFTHDSVTTMEAQLRSALPHHICRHIRVLEGDLVLPKSAKFNYKGPVPKSKRADAFTALPFSDLFRYEMLRQRGGIWMDLDIVLIRPIPAAILRQPYFFVSERTMQKGAYASKNPIKPTNSCIGARAPHSQWAEWIVAASKEAKLEGAWTYMKVFQESLIELGLEDYVEPPTFVMPVNWWDLDGIFTPMSTSDHLKSKYGVPGTGLGFLKDPKTIGVHLFRGILRKRDMPYEDRSKIPPTSLLGRLFGHVEAAAV